MQALVTTEWLDDHLSEVVICDVRWYLADVHQGRAEYADGHIPGAVYLDVETDLTAPNGPGRHPLPTREGFGETLSRWGISNDDHVVVYDNSGGAIAARLWWMLRWLGHERVSVLDGGIGAWLTHGGSLSVEVPSIEATNFTVGSPLQVAVDREFVETEGHAFTLLDARAPERYQGLTEPVDAAAGHIPGAINIPFATNVADGYFLNPEQLGGKYEDAPTIAYCGSGVTACHTILAFHIAGLTSPYLYEGSWSDWAGSGGPVATGV